MRFGAALILWSEEDLRATQEQESARECVVEAQSQDTADGIRAVRKEASEAGADVKVLDPISAVGTAMTTGAPHERARHRSYGNGRDRR